MDHSPYATNDPNLIFDQLERERRLAVADGSWKDRNAALYRNGTGRLAALATDSSLTDDMMNDIKEYLVPKPYADDVQWCPNESGWVAKPPFTPNRWLDVPVAPKRYVTIRTRCFDRATDNALARLVEAGVGVREVAKLYADEHVRYLMPRLHNVTGELLGGFFMVDAGDVEGA